MRWATVLFAGAAAGLLTVIFVYQAVYVLIASHGLVTGGDLNRERLDLLVRTVGVWGALVFFGVSVTVAAYLVTRGTGELSVAHGVTVGLLAAFVQQTIIHLTAPPVRPGEALTLVALGLIGGWVGAREGRRAAAKQESAYRASRDVASADNAREVAAAVGRHMADGETEGIAIWRNRDPGRAELLASWAPRGRSGAPPGTGRGGEPSDEVLETSRRQAWTVTSVPTSGGRTGCVLLVPLAAGSRRVGVLAVAFPRRARLYRGRSGST
jgi:hypothetical protein